MQAWIRTHSEAKQLFWKTCQPSADNSREPTFDSLSEDDKAIYRLGANAEDIPEAFYAKVSFLT